MKIVTVVGARPQFIKAAVGSREIRKNHTEIFVHTGQHHDANMSDVFFSEMGIPVPDYNLGVSGGTHAQMTGKMLVGIEEILLREKPDMLLVYGDTNSTLAAALAAVKLHIPVAHVESGNRFGTLDSPEEVNRIVTDRISTLRFACTKSAYDFLCAEGLSENSFVSGDPMYDAFLYYKPQAENCVFTLTGMDGEQLPVPKSYYYMTCHRQENTGTPETLMGILSAMDSLDAPTVYPVHPRNRATVKAIIESNRLNKIIFTEPVGYIESLSLVCGAEKIVTDSGGLQREAFFAEKQCVTVLDFIVWPETMTDNRNQLAKPEKNDIIKKLSCVQTVKPEQKPFGDGHSAGKICDIINRWYEKRN